MERHFITTHKNFNTTFPINSEYNKKKISELKLKLTKQQNLFARPISQSTKTTFKIAHLLAKKMKPFVEGEIIKEAMLLSAETLFDDHKSKNEIVTAINGIQLSARTVTRRIEMMATDIESQLNTALSARTITRRIEMIATDIESQLNTDIQDIQKSVFFSLQVHESTDVSDTSQLCIIINMVFEDFIVKEEFLKMLPLTGRTRGEDIYMTFKKFLGETNIPLKKLSSITTDGAPAMKGRNSGFIALCKRDPMFPKFASYHCIIHQEVLCSKVIPFQDIIQTVTKIINSIRAGAMQHRLFKLLLQENGAEFDDLITHSSTVAE
uniref:Protein ZBED8-like n=1 Tax=Diabrotica virgifera virgifera TaxID=50390 RepID=A0A6P7GD25_DIAVI